MNPKNTNSTDISPVFDWVETNEPTDSWVSTCPWCDTATAMMRGPEDDDVNTHRKCECPLCGWKSSRYIWLSKRTGMFDGIYKNSVLKEFQDLDSSSLSVDEIGSYLRRSFSDIYSISWRRFEELVEGVFKHQGFETILTQQTRDEGADILIISNGRTQAIIECKKYSESRTLGVEIVRSLVGACVDWNVKRAYLVTTTDATAPARLKVADYKRRGYDIDLVTATELSELLGVYSKTLPGLEHIDQEKRIEIASKWEADPGWRVLKSKDEILKSMGWLGN